MQATSIVDSGQVLAPGGGSVHVPRGSRVVWVDGTAVFLADPAARAPGGPPAAPGGPPASVLPGARGPRRRRAEVLAEALRHPSGAVAGLIDTSRQSAKRCDPQTEVVRCGCRWRIVQQCCMDRDCLTCAAEVGRRRAKSLRSRLVAGSPLDSTGLMFPWGYTVLTVPPAIRARFADPVAWRKLARQAFQVLRRRFGAVFAVEASHPIGDPDEAIHRSRADDDPGVFHPHLNFLWVRDRYWGQIDVDLLRVEWARILGWVEVGSDGKPAGLDVWHGFKSSEARRSHAIRYVSRSFPGWGFWLPSVRWYGKFPRKAPAEVKVCDHCHQKVRVVARGWWGEQIAAAWTAAGLPAGERVRPGRAPPWGEDAFAPRAAEVPF